MDIRAQVDMLTSSDNKQAYKALKDLIVMSEKSQDIYSYFDRFVEMMNADHSYIRTRGLRLIAYCSKWDTENKVNAIINDYLKHMEDEKPITARQCIKDTVIIAKYKPELIDILLKQLEDIHKVYEDSMQKLIYQDRQIAIRQIKQYTF